MLQFIEHDIPNSEQFFISSSFDLDDSNTENVNEKQLKSIKMPKKCKEHRDRKASRAGQMESANVQLTEELQVELPKLKEKYPVISKLKAKVSEVENHNVVWMDEFLFELFIADYLKDIDILFI